MESFIAKHWPLIPPVESPSMTVNMVSAAVWEIGGNALIGIEEGIRERKPENFALVPMYCAFMGLFYGFGIAGGVVMDSKAVFDHAKSAVRGLRETVDHFTN